MTLKLQGYPGILNGKDAVQGNVKLSGIGTKIDKFFPVTINIYGRCYSTNPPLVPILEASVDNNTYNESTDIILFDTDDPIYQLVFTYTGIIRDIFIRPSESDIMLGDQISQTGTTVDDYPYSNSIIYKYSIHNGLFINNNINLYFQIANSI